MLQQQKEDRNMYDNYESIDDIARGEGFIIDDDDNEEDDDWDE